MDDERIERIARAMCRSAGIDPDQEIGPEFRLTAVESMSPATCVMPAWLRFRRAAENACAAIRELAYDSQAGLARKRRDLG